MIWIIASVGLLIIVLSYVIKVYNSLVKRKNMIEDQWAQIDVVLKRRADLIPKLVDVIKAYAKHEKETFADVVNLRNQFVNSSSIKEEVENNKEVVKGLSKIMVIAEAYPELKANENFKGLQDELSETEDKIQIARQFYNDAVLNYRNILETFPSNIIANLFNFKKIEFYEVLEEDRISPSIKF